MALPPRLRALRDHLTASLWLLPTVSALIAIVGGSWLATVEVEPSGPLGRWVFSGTPAGARALLETIAGSVITVTSLTFSLTVVALQLAATQYTPRLLRTFLSDRGTQVVLSIFVATFAYSITVLRTVRSEGDGITANVPQVALTVETALALASVAALVYFIHHITQKIRVDSILADVSQGTVAAVAALLDPHPQGLVDSGALPSPPPHATGLRASGSGVVQGVSGDSLMRVAVAHDVVLRIRRTVGERVTDGTVLAWAWPCEGRDPLDSVDTDALAAAANRAVRRGSERTISGDPSFGMRQLVDIALRALSPSLNDPTTAVDTIGTLAGVLRELATEPVGHQLLQHEGRLHVALPRPAFADYVGLCVNQVASAGGSDLLVVRALLRLLGDLGEVVEDGDRRQALRRAVDRVRQEARAQLQLPQDMAAAESAAREALVTIDGRPSAAQAFLL